MPIENLGTLERGLPRIRQRFKTHRAYGEADVEAVLGAAVESAEHLEARCLTTTLFLNRGDRFVSHPLPDEAQFAPVWSVHIADFNSDGTEDVFLAQNFFATVPRIPRLDAGRGLILLGDGQGQLQPLPGTESGIRVFGDSRGAAVGDFNRDGRPDLVISQNGEATRLFENRMERTSLRVRLRGLAPNTRAIGAQVRVASAGRWGPAREVRGGTGYLSQDSLTILASAPGPVESIRVRWPGGLETTSPVPNEAREIVVEHAGDSHHVRGVR